MERNTKQLLGNLQAGDRFYFPKKQDEVWEVVLNNEKGGYCEVNRPFPNTMRYPDMKRKTITVIFIRHTNTEEVTNDNN